MEFVQFLLCILIVGVGFVVFYIMLLARSIVDTGNKIVVELRGIKERIGAEKRLICAVGNHLIGNELYTFEHDPDGGHVDEEPICFRCMERRQAMADKSLQDTIDFVRSIRSKKADEENK